MFGSDLRYTNQEREREVKVEVKADMRQGVEYSPVGEGLGMREYWLYACMRKISLMAAHCVALLFTVLIGVLSRPGTSEFIHSQFITSCKLELYFSS